MNILPPWAQGPFELIVHAEEHLLNGDDFDRRIALISFDNAVEVAIATYLSLNPIQRGGKTYAKADIERWLNNYHSKLDFLDEELISRGLVWKVDRASIVWAHDHRGEQYHGGKKGIPPIQCLEIIREVALWTMSILYGIADIEKALSETIAGKLPPPPVQSDKKYDRAIDEVYGMVDVAGQIYHASELLFSVDGDAYRELGLNLTTKPPKGEEDK